MNTIATPTTLDVAGLVKSYGARRVFDRWSLAAKVGVTWVRGANGSGKTTLLECLAGIEPYEGGSIVLRSQAGEMSLARARNAYLERVFYVPNRLEIHPQVTIGDFAALVRRKGDLDPTAVASRASAFGVYAAPNRAISSLSFGTQKKLMLSFAFASDCPVLLLDEPTEGLDADAVATFENGMRANASRVWIVASHDAAFIGRFAPHVVDLP